MKPELKPCPFCGEKDNLIIEHCKGTILHPAYRVSCDNCGASNGYTDKGDHVEKWSRRAQPSEPVHPVYKAAYDALRYYVDASDKELAERGITRDEALRLVRVEEFKLSQLAEPVKVPIEEIIESVKAYGRAYSMPNTTATELTIRIQDIRALLQKYGIKP